MTFSASLHRDGRRPRLAVHLHAGATVVARKDARARRRFCAQARWDAVVDIERGGEGVFAGAPEPPVPKPRVWSADEQKVGLWGRKGVGGRRGGVRLASGTWVAKWTHTLVAWAADAAASQHTPTWSGGARPTVYVFTFCASSPGMRQSVPTCRAPSRVARHEALRPHHASLFSRTRSCSNSVSLLGSPLQPPGANEYIIARFCGGLVAVHSARSAIAHDVFVTMGVGQVPPLLFAAPPVHRYRQGPMGVR